MIISYVICMIFCLCGPYTLFFLMDMYAFQKALFFNFYNLYTWKIKGRISPEELINSMAQKRRSSAQRVHSGAQYT